ncbi:MAG: hypothetical protein QOF36_1855 [Microbacteriaceae bacterium]|jgi:hypothetical protein|nr:hypothetical protein [Microbacteriaceae bacterium]
MAAELVVFGDRHVLDLQVSADRRFGQLDVAVELRRRVLGELEQRPELRPGAAVVSYAHGAHRAAAGTWMVSEDT